MASTQECIDRYNEVKEFCEKQLKEEAYESSVSSNSNNRLGNAIKALKQIEILESISGTSEEMDAQKASILESLNSMHDLLGQEIKDTNFIDREPTNVEKAKMLHDESLRERFIEKPKADLVKVRGQAIQHAAEKIQDDATKLGEAIFLISENRDKFIKHFSNSQMEIQEEIKQCQARLEAFYEKNDTDGIQDEITKLKSLEVKNRKLLELKDSISEKIISGAYKEQEKAKANLQAFIKKHAPKSDDDWDESPKLDIDELTNDKRQEYDRLVKLEREAVSQFDNSHKSKKDIENGSKRINDNLSLIQEKAKAQLPKDENKNKENISPSVNGQSTLAKALKKRQGGLNPEVAKQQKKEQEKKEKQQLASKPKTLDPSKGNALAGLFDGGKKPPPKIVQESHKVQEQKNKSEAKVDKEQVDKQEQKSQGTVEGHVEDIVRRTLPNRSALFADIHKLKQDDSTSAEMDREQEAELKLKAEEEVKQKAEKEAQQKPDAEKETKQEAKVSQPDRSALFADIHKLNQDNSASAEMDREQEAEEEARQKAEEEAKQKAEEEAKQKAEEEAKQKAEEEAKQKAEEAKQKAEEEVKQKAEKEVYQKVEPDQGGGTGKPPTLPPRPKENEEAKQKAAEEAKQKAEEEAKRKAEEEAKRKAEEEAKQKAEEEAKQKAEEEAKQKAEEEAKQKAEKEVQQKVEPDQGGGTGKPPPPPPRKGSDDNLDRMIQEYSKLNPEDKQLFLKNNHESLQDLINYSENQLTKYDNEGDNTKAVFYGKQCLEITKFADNIKKRNENIQIALRRLNRVMDISLINEVNEQPVLATYVTTQREARALQTLFNGINIQVETKLDSSNPPFKFQVAINCNEENCRILADNKNNSHFLRYISRSLMAGDRPSSNITSQNIDWEIVNSDFDFASSNKQNVVVLGTGANNQERVLIDRSSPIIEDLSKMIINKCEGKSVEQILQIVNSEIDALTAKEGRTRTEIEDELDEKLEQYLSQREKGLINGKPANRDVPLDELMEQKMLVCRHKGPLAAHIMGELIKEGILPPGSARTYRSNVSNESGQNIGAHQWSVYRDGTNGDLWVNDPRWLKVTNVNQDDFINDELGIGIIEKANMVGRLDKADLNIMDKLESERQLSKGTTEKDETNPLIKEQQDIDGDSKLEAEAKQKSEEEVLPTLEEAEQLMSHLESDDEEKKLKANTLQENLKQKVQDPDVANLLQNLEGKDKDAQLKIIKGNHQSYSQVLGGIVTVPDSNKANEGELIAATIHNLLSPLIAGMHYVGDINKAKKEQEKSKESKVKKKSNSSPMETTEALSDDIETIKKQSSTPVDSTLTQKETVSFDIDGDSDELALSNEDLSSDPIEENKQNISQKKSNSLPMETTEALFNDIETMARPNSSPIDMEDMKLEEQEKNATGLPLFSVSIRENLKETAELGESLGLPLFTVKTKQAPESELNPLGEGKNSSLKEDDEFEDVFSVSKGKPTVTSQFEKAKGEKLSGETSELEETLQSKYQEAYGGNEFFNKLAEVIEVTAEQTQGGMFKSKIADEHKQRCENIAIQMDFAKRGAMSELTKLQNDPLATDDEKNKAKAKVQVATKLQEMFSSLGALSSHRYRYNENTFNKHLNDINDMMEDLGCKDDAPGILQAVIEAEKNQIFSKEKWYKSKGLNSLEFDSQRADFKVPENYKGRFSVEHENNGQKVIVNFDLNRNNLLGKQSIINPLGREQAYTSLKSQSKDAVLIAIAEHGKGSPENPINIKYGTDNKGREINQPDLALSILLEFKKEAILQGKTFDVMHEGKIVKITPDEDFAPDEMAMFTKYATDPAAKAGKNVGSTPGGAAILRHAGDDSITDNKDFKNIPKVEAALKSYVSGQVAKAENRFDNIDDGLSKRRANRGLST